MESDEEIRNSQIIGFIEAIPNTENAKITVVGFKNSNEEYEALDRKRIQKIFPPDGKVFAYKFHSDTVPLNTFIEFSARFTINQNVNGDAYIIDYNKLYKSIILTPIITINYQTSLESGFITQDEIFSCINKNDLKNISGYFLIKSQNALYGPFRYETSSESVRPIEGKQANEYEIDTIIYNSKCIKINQQEYCLCNSKSIPFKQIGIIDCMDDKQLAEWFRVLLKSTVKSEQIMSIGKEIFQDFFSNFKETNDVIDEIRLERVKGKVDSLEFNTEEIKELLETDSALTNNLTSSLEKMKDEYYAIWAKPLQEEKDKLEKEITELKDKKNQCMLEISNVEKSKTEIEKNYYIIKDNYDVIVECIKLESSLTDQSSVNTKQLSLENKSPVPIEFKAMGEQFSDLEENEGYTFHSLLKENIKDEDLPKELIEQLNKNSELFSYKACFIPSISWAYFYAKAISNSRLYTIHVEHDWLHFKDFENSGLIQILKLCERNKDINYIIVFDSLNLTQPECGLKPLLDIINGYSLILPIYNKSLPDNLKIFATIVPFNDENKIGLPLDASSFLNWGQVSNPQDKIPLSKDFLQYNSSKGYFIPKELMFDLPKKNERVNNGYFA